MLQIVSFYLCLFFAKRPTWVTSGGDVDSLADHVDIPDVPRSQSPSSDGLSGFYTSDGDALEDIQVRAISIILMMTN